MVDKINGIIDILIDSTISGHLLWSEVGNGSNRSFSRVYSSVGEDGTIYDMEIKYSFVNGEWRLPVAGLMITSDKLPGGSYYVYGNRHDSYLLRLRNLLVDTYCGDMDISDNIIEDAFDSISRGISISTYRDNSLNKLLS
jgi:hypothetical protein